MNAADRVYEVFPRLAARAFLQAGFSPPTADDVAVLVFDSVAWLDQAVAAEHLLDSGERRRAARFRFAHRVEGGGWGRWRPNRAAFDASAAPRSASRGGTTIARPMVTRSFGFAKDARETLARDHAELERLVAERTAALKHEAERRLEAEAQAMRAHRLDSCHPATLGDSTSIPWGVGVSVAGALATRLGGLGVGRLHPPPSGPWEHPVPQSPVRTTGNRACWSIFEPVGETPRS